MQRLVAWCYCIVPFRFDAVNPVGGPQGFATFEGPPGYVFTSNPDAVFDELIDPQRLGFLLEVILTPLSEITEIPDATGQVIVVEQVGSSTPPPLEEESGSTEEGSESGEEDEPVATGHSEDDGEPAGEREVLVCS